MEVEPERSANRENKINSILIDKPVSVIVNDALKEEEKPFKNKK